MCSGRTGHAEVVIVVFDPKVITLRRCLSVWNEHDPTQGMRQGNDIGTSIDRRSRHNRRPADGSGGLEGGLRTDLGRGLRAITTEIGKAPPFYYAEPYHQQYLSKIPDGYCGLRGTGELPHAHGGDRLSAAKRLADPARRRRALRRLIPEAPGWPQTDGPGWIPGQRSTMKMELGHPVPSTPTFSFAPQALPQQRFADGRAHGPQLGSRDFLELMKLAQPGRSGINSNQGQRASRWSRAPHC